jgi:predicted CXXCH cytochrome family protein
MRWLGSLCIAAVVLTRSLTVSLSSQTGVASPRSDPPAAAPSPAPPPPEGRAYVGSQACRRCHQPIYDRWAKTRMANVVTDPREHPENVIPDFNKTDPLLTFKLADVAFVYGSKWKQRYFAKVGNDYFPLPAQWDVSHRLWRPYMVQPNTDWWVRFYPADNMKRPTGPTCDGCHSVNYNVQTKTETEWNVGCEKCHGPGSEHVRRPAAATIVNPARLDYVRATDTCMQCHTQGQPLTNPILGQYYDWPVGFHQGGRLNEFWKLEEHALGETSFTHFPDGTGHKNRMQGNDFAQSVMYRRGVTCFSCHDVHGTPNDADLIKPARLLCTTCHGTASPNGPHAASLEAHTHHMAGSPGSECVACHMPKIEQTIADVNVRSHTFRFITPSMTDQYKIPNPCTSCHTDRTTQWAREALNGWSAVSPWRIN